MWRLGRDGLQTPPPATRGQNRATYRGGGGRRQQRKDASAGDDDVVHHLRDEMDGVVDEDDVLVAVHKVHYGLGGVTARGGKRSPSDRRCFVVRNSLSPIKRTRPERLGKGWQLFFLHCILWHALA